jgi:putative RNA 2'-phosphotransferase
VHLSPDCETAQRVEKRHGPPVVLTIQAGRMHLNGYLFYLSKNGVWLTTGVPTEYINLPIVSLAPAVTGRARYPLNL